jgi:hypothetical protein
MIDLRGCTTIDQVVAKVGALIDEGQAEAMRRLLTALLVNEVDLDQVDAEMAAHATANAARRAELLAAVRAWFGERGVH